MLHSIIVTVASWCAIGHRFLSDSDSMLFSSVQLLLWVILTMVLDGSGLVVLGVGDSVMMELGGICGNAANVYGF